MINGMVSHPSIQTSLSILTHHQGINYALTLLGALAAVLVPLPVIFLLYGKKIRARSKFAPAYDLKMERMKKDEESGSSDADSPPEKGGDTNGEKSA